jgi:putative molybdopterin biosynthesis protein
MLEAFSAGYALDEIGQALEVAKDRWRAAAQQQNQPDQQFIRFAGSHDMVVIWLAGHLGEICPGASLQLSFSGSLGGLMALAGGKAELAGCHLLDAETGVYNEPYLRKLFPSKRMFTVRLALRRIGLITAPGNPKDLRDLQHLAQPGLRFVNRQPGSGTRVWLDAQLRRLNLEPSRINGYTLEKLTHSEVARAVAEGQADAGLGLQSAAAAFSLGFIPLVEEPYDLVTYQDLAGQPHLKTLFEWLAAPANWSQMAHLPGYDFSQTGQVSVLDL